MRRHPLLTLTLASALALGMAACGDPVAPADAPPEGEGTRYTASATVLDDGDGAELCLGAVNDSYPPQCGGPKIVGWDWADVEGEESSGGTTWGSYTVVGTFDGERLTLTERPRPPSAQGDPHTGEPDHFATPCDPPPGGWAPTDPARATDEAQTQAITYARAQPEFAGLWVDQSINPASRAEEPDAEGAMNDPAQLVLNARFTDDLDRHEAAMREIWGGALCVSQARHSMTELEEIRVEAEEELRDVLFSDVDEVTGVVSFHVMVAEPRLQRTFDERYGEGVVRVTGALRPVE